MAVITSRAAVAPVGCPTATAPPFTFVRSRRRIASPLSPEASTSVDTSGTAANASLISRTSMSPSVRPACFRASCPATAGMEAMRCGSPAAADQPTIRAIAAPRPVRPPRSTSIAEPELRSGAFPAVTVALPLTVGSRPRTSTDVSGLRALRRGRGSRRSHRRQSSRRARSRPRRSAARGRRRSAPGCGRPTRPALVARSRVGGSLVGGLDRTGHARVRTRDDKLVGENDVARAAGRTERTQGSTEHGSGSRLRRRPRARLAAADAPARHVDGGQRRTAGAVDRVRGPVVRDAGTQLHLPGDRAVAAREVDPDHHLVDPVGPIDASSTAPRGRQRRSGPPSSGRGPASARAPPNLPNGDLA